jgi:hypothetical protein
LCTMSSGNLRGVNCKFSYIYCILSNRTLQYERT